jgi:hypothetical protein
MGARYTSIVPEFFLVAFGGIAILAPFGFFAARTQDRLIRTFHDLHLEEWTNYGGPRGWFWKPPGNLMPTAVMSFMHASSTWVFRLPSSLASDPKARRDQLQLRLWVFLWNGGVISLFAFLFIRFGFPPRT